MRTSVCSGLDVAGVLESIGDRIAAGLKPTLAVVFASVVHDLEAIRRALDERGIAFVGVTTAGEIADRVILEEGCSTLLLEADPGSFDVWFGGVSPEESLYDVARRLGEGAVSRFAEPVVIAFASGLRSDGEAVVRGIQAGAGRQIPLFGGIAGDDLKMTRTLVFSGRGTSCEGIAALILDGSRFVVEGIATNGWQAVGVEKIVTSARDNVVYTIDGEPAVDVYRKYLDIDDVEVPTGASLALGVQYPLSVARPNGTSVIRAPLFYGPEKGSLIFAGSVPEGARVKFCIPPAVDIVERVVDEVREVHNEIPDADAVLMVSCKARHVALGPLAEEEVEELHAMWNVPMAGYFSYGEIGGREPRHCDFHTDTCTLVVLKQTPR